MTPELEAALATLADRTLEYRLKITAMEEQIRTLEEENKELRRHLNGPKE